jgi:hypothetical protein
MRVDSLRIETGGGGGGRHPIAGEQGNNTEPVLFPLKQGNLYTQSTQLLFIDAWMLPVTEMHEWWCFKNIYWNKSFGISMKYKNLK